MNYKIYKLNTCIIGSGAAGLNCADTLYNLGQHDIAIVTEGLNMGTSRNTGSDKQTYYKLTLAGDGADSVGDMAKTLFENGAMHGDIALTEAANSVRAFGKLVELGVPFPYNDYGEYVGYKTDHDPRSRAVSCGPLTSKYMTESLEKAVKVKNIKIFDGYRVIQILTEENNAVGFIAVNKNSADSDIEFAMFDCENIVYAVGGPSAIYHSTVYPESQTCSHGIGFSAGAVGINLTESQYGIASVKFRWNLSGSYQQVIPRYFSVDENGINREFLADYIDNAADIFNMTFLKGYQWPFDPRKLSDGSSRIDMAIYHERQKNRRIFMDYTVNPSCFDFNILSSDAYNYLHNSDALLNTPIERLIKMNEPAYLLYKSHGIDLMTEPLEINVCAQHNNGGFAGDIWYESLTLKHFFPIGEANGVFGVYRPGGSALNSTQVSSLRAAVKIADCYRLQTHDFNGNNFTNIFENCIAEEPTMSLSEIIAEREKYGKLMDNCGAFIRNHDEIVSAIDMIHGELLAFFDKYKTDNARDLVEIAINRDVFITQYVYLNAIKEYIEHGGKSRGSYLIDGDYKIDTEHQNQVCYVKYTDGDTKFKWENVRPIPQSEQWFETVYNKFIHKK
jgi:succinate dehydrogenase/fumarate reductase flavoprotein subunit